MRSRKLQRMAGFSLLEIMLVVAILTIVMAVVFQQVANVQKTSRAEDQKLDLTQEGREFIDQFVRDIHQAGFPNERIYAAGVLSSPPANDSRVAVGLVKFARDEVWLEADVDGDGTVESINYKLETASGAGQCPCKISRSQVTKVNGAPMSQTVSYTIELNDVLNSGGANGGASDTATYTIYGTSYSNSQSNDTLYATYKNANVFTAYDAAGNEVTPTDIASAPALLKTIKTIRVTVNLLAPNWVAENGWRPVITLSGSSRVGNN